jgi:hypothetical protein
LPLKPQNQDIHETSSELLIVEPCSSSSSSPSNSSDNEVDDELDVDVDVDETLY